MKSKIHKLVGIVDQTVQESYLIGTNDCNILVLKTLDLLCDTDYTIKALGKYTSIKEGIQIFKDNGFSGLEDLVLKHCEVVDSPIFGDIYVDGINASVFLHGSYVQIDHERHVFNNTRIPKELTGKIYRIRK